MKESEEKQTGEKVKKPKKQSSKLCCVSPQADNMDNKRKRRRGESGQSYAAEEERYEPGPNYSERPDRKNKNKSESREQSPESSKEYKKRNKKDLIAISSASRSGDGSKIEECSRTQKDQENTIADLHSKIQQLNEDNENYDKSNLKQGKKIHTLTSEIDALNKSNDDLTNEKKGLTETIEAWRQKIEEQGAEIDALKKSYNDLANENRELTETNEAQRQTIEEQGSKINALEAEVKELASGRDQMHIEFQEKLQKTEEAYHKNLEDSENEKKLKKKLDELKADFKKKEKEYQQLERDYEKNNKIMGQISRRLEELKREKADADQYIMELSVQKKDLSIKYDNLQSRFSKMAAQQLTANNPQIEDLGDRNRPMKVAENFRHDLYGNEWCDAYELLIDEYERTEEEAIETLLNICMVIFNQCQMVSKNQLLVVGSALNICQVSLEDDNEEMFTFDGNDQFWQLMIERRRTVDDKRLENIYQICERKLLEKNKDVIEIGGHVESFVKKCVNICWKMVIQDPPMMLLADIKNGSYFNKDLWDVYSKKSGIVDFLVWPAILREENGSILQKGVAEGKKHSKKSNIETKPEHEETECTDEEFSTAL